MENSHTNGRERKLVRAVALITFVVAVGLPLVSLITAATGLRDVETEPGAVDYVFMVGLVIAVAVVFWLFVPWALRGDDGRQAKIGLVLGLLAWLTGVVFWTMAPVVLGAAAAVTGRVGMLRNQSRSMTAAAMVLGISAAVVTVGFYIAGF